MKVAEAFERLVRQDALFVLMGLDAMRHSWQLAIPQLALFESGEALLADMRGESLPHHTSSMPQRRTLGLRS